jgi:indolepyruvate ferredoxin oxidoreductase alpha subunit
VRSNADMTVLVLDNATVAMTGGQSTLVAGDQLMTLLRGLGVPEEHLHLIEPLPTKHRENVELISRAINHRGLSVIVERRACVQIKPAKKPLKKKADPKPAEAATK